MGPSAAAEPTLRFRLVRGLGLAALLAAVGVAFADSSIVVLALPELLAQFDGSITQVAWVVTAYNLVLAVAAFVLVRLGPRFDPGRMALVGGAVFLAASLACAAAPELWSLNAFRAVQGLGAALLLLGALPLTRRLAATPERGSALWTGAGVLGAALGPALGGVLTELLGWRSIFLVQAPFAALAVVVALVLGRSGGETAPAAAGAPDSDPGGARRRRAAGAALALASAALVGLLFLAVVMLVDVWRLSPLGAGAVVTTIPLATLAAAPFLPARASGRRAGAALVSAGAILLAGGLAGMAFLPAHSLAWVVAALAIAGFGYGLLVPSVARAALAEHGSPVSSGAMSLALRHAGLVAGLVVLTPLLTADLIAAGDKAELRGISVLLDAPVPAGDKLRVAIDLAPVLATPTREGLPDFGAALAGEPGGAVAGLGRQLDATVSGTVTRGFRRSFVVAALFALLSTVPIVLASARRPGWRRARAPAAALLVGTVLVAAEFAAGAAAYGTQPQLLPPCAERAVSDRPGADAAAQRAVLDGLDRVACVLGDTREQLVSDLAHRGAGAADLAVRVARFLHLPGLP